MVGQMSDIERQGIDPQICGKRVDVAVIMSSCEHLFRNVDPNLSTEELLDRLYSIRIKTRQAIADSSVVKIF